MNGESVNQTLKWTNLLPGRRAIVCLGVAGLILGSGPQPSALAQIETRTFNATADSFNYHTGGVVNNGANPTMEAGGLNGNRNSRLLVRFDPTSVLPSNVNVVSATLRLTTVRIDNFTSLGVQDMPNSIFSLAAYRVNTTNWVEGSGFFTIDNGGVTWDWMRYNVVGQQWDVPGPDPTSTNIADAATATMVWTQTPSLGWRFSGNTNFTWDLAADLNAWNADRSSALPSWLIISDKEATGTTNNGVVFASRQNANVALHPLLTIDFIAIPEPSATFLLVLAGTAGACYRSRRGSAA